MPRVTERQRQYANRAWQCQGRLAYDARYGGATVFHICQIAEGHYGPHLCWCECLFDEAGTIYDQMGLWGSTKATEAHNPWP